MELLVPKNKNIIQRWRDGGLYSKVVVVAVFLSLAASLYLLNISQGVSIASYLPGLVRGEDKDYDRVIIIVMYFSTSVWQMLYLSGVLVKISDGIQGRKEWIVTNVSIVLIVAEVAILFFSLPLAGLYPTEWGPKIGEMWELVVHAENNGIAFLRIISHSMILALSLLEALGPEICIAISLYVTGVIDWQPAKLSRREIRSRLSTMGLSADELIYYLREIMLEPTCKEQVKSLNKLMQSQVEQAARVFENPEEALLNAARRDPQRYGALLIASAKEKLEDYLGETDPGQLSRVIAPEPSLNGGVSEEGES